MVSTVMLTESNCHTGIAEAEAYLASAISEDEKQTEQAKLLLWDRLLFHIREGKIVTIDSEDRIKLWENNIPS